MSFKNVDIEAGLRRLAERRIEEAMREGKFDNLQGAGKPLDLEPMPANEEARLVWWALKLMKQNDFIPEEVQWRKQIDAYRDEIATATTDRRVKALVAAHNGLVHQINTLGTNALKVAVAPLRLDVELHKLREKMMPAPESPDPLAPPLVCRIQTCLCANPQTATFCRRCGAALG